VSKAQQEVVVLSHSDSSQSHYDHLTVLQ